MKYSVVDVRDIAAVAAHVLTEAGHEWQRYTITGPAAISHTEIAERFSKRSGAPSGIDVTEEAAGQVLLGAGLPAWQVDKILTVPYCAARRGGHLHGRAGGTTVPILRAVRAIMRRCLGAEANGRPAEKRGRHRAHCLSTLLHSWRRAIAERARGAPRGRRPAAATAASKA